MNLIPEKVNKPSPHGRNGTVANTEGMTYKFSVFKNEDIEQLTHHEKVALGHIAESIEQNRKASGKNPRNTYLVINTDEAYADQVIDILKANGHWGEEWNGARN